MPYVSENHRRCSFRLAGYEYSQVGGYFITICTHQRLCLFGDVVDGVMELNHFGRIVQETWDALPIHYQHIGLDEFVVMPNHVHGIIMLLHDLDVDIGAGLKPAPTRHGLPEIVRGLKTFSSRSINQLRQTPGQPIWQRNYYEHVIRTQDDLDDIRQYILGNPAKWPEDHENPQNIRLDGSQ